MWIRRRTVEDLELRVHEEEIRRIWLVVRIAQIRNTAEAELARIERDGGTAGFARRILELTRDEEEALAKTQGR